MQAGPGHAPKLVPRVILELAPQDMVALLQQPASGLALVLDEIEANGYDGIVRKGDGRSMHCLACQMTRCYLHKWGLQKQPSLPA